MVLPLVLSDLFQDGQILLLDAIILRFLPIHRLLLFHFIVVQILYVLLVHISYFRQIFYMLFSMNTCKINNSSGIKASAKSKDVKTSLFARITL